MSTNWETMNERNIIKFGPDWYSEMAAKLGSTDKEIENDKKILKPNITNENDLNKWKPCANNCDHCKSWAKQINELKENANRKPRIQTTDERNTILRYYGIYMNNVL